jgi:anti-sigma B factor antagonist
VALSLQSRSIGNITVVSCTGRIVEGEESDALSSRVNRLLPIQPFIVFDLGGVSFIDSAGLGLLFRLRTRARAANGDLKICAVGDHIREVLRVTKLDTILPAYQTESEAVTAFYSRTDATDKPSGLEIDVLCVHPSWDVLAYVCELLKHAGYRVATTNHVFDAQILLRATRPAVLVVALKWQSSGLTESADTGFAAPVRVVQLPAEFSTEDPGDAAHQLLDDVSRAMLQTSRSSL